MGLVRSRAITKMIRKDYVRVVFDCDKSVELEFKELKQKALDAIKKNEIYFECVSPANTKKVKKND